MLFTYVAQGISGLRRNSGGCGARQVHVPAVPKNVGVGDIASASQRLSSGF